MNPARTKNIPVASKHYLLSYELIDIIFSIITFHITLFPLDNVSQVGLIRPRPVAVYERYD